MTRALALTLLRILIVVAACLFGVYWLVIRDMYYTPVEALRSGHGWPPASVHMVVPWP